MKQEVFFSVVIPMFNAEPFIHRAIQSVLTQTFQDFEILLINDGSTDKSLEKVNEIIDPRIRVFSQENRGVSSARNRGIHESKGKFNAFLDADDEWLPNFLEVISELIMEFPECGLFATNYYFSDSEGSNPAKVNYPDGWKGVMPDYFKDLLTGFPINSSSVTIRNLLLIRVSGFPENMHFGEDQNTWMRLALIAKFAYFNNPLSIYHRESVSITDIKRTISTAKPHQHAVFLYDLIKSCKIPTEYSQSITDLLAKYYYPEIRQSILNGDRMGGLNLLMRVRKTKYCRSRWIRFFCSCFLPSSLVKLILLINKD